MMEEFTQNKEWCMKKKKERIKEEEEIIRGKVGILKFMLGARKKKKTHLSN